jgi:hypothetical protein
MSRKGRAIGAAGGAVGLSGFAAVLGLCCSMPWAVAILGVTGAVGFARLAFLLPYALIGAGVLLAAGFWLAYRPLPPCPDGSCAPEPRRLLRVVIWITTALVGALAFVALAPPAAAQTVGYPAYTELDESGTALRDYFNRARGTVRLLFVVDPICPMCLRGLDDLNRSLLSKTDDARLQTFVVHVPVLGAKAKAVAPAAELLDNPHVRHYWQESGEFGRMLAEAAGLRQGDDLVYAWDVWLIYGSEAVWDGALPPRPRLLMHQLRALQGGKKYPRLDGEAFAQEAASLLARLPAPEATR